EAADPPAEVVHALRHELEQLGCQAPPALDIELSAESHRPLYVNEHHGGELALGGRDRDHVGALRALRSGTVAGVRQCTGRCTTPCHGTGLHFTYLEAPRGRPDTRAATGSGV